MRSFLLRSSLLFTMLPTGIWCPPPWLFPTHSFEQLWATSHSVCALWYFPPWEVSVVGWVLPPAFLCLYYPPQWQGCWCSANFGFHPVAVLQLTGLTGCFVESTGQCEAPASAVSRTLSFLGGFSTPWMMLFPSIHRCTPEVSVLLLLWLPNVPCSCL